jgi:hypothetical protein
MLPQVFRRGYRHRLQAATVPLDVWQTLKVDFLQGSARHTSPLLNC